MVDDDSSDDEREAEINRQCQKYGCYFGWMSQCSQYALKRETQAKSFFHRAKEEFEASRVALSLPPGQKHVMEDAVPPSCHLTTYTWKSFRSWVEDCHPGWKAKRRVASDKEIYECEDKCPSRGKSYFVSFVFRDPSGVKKNASDKKRGPDEEEEMKKPPAKKAKSKSKAALGFADLPDVLQTHVLSFCDVSSLGALAPTSKTMNRLVKQDRFWEPHLKILLQEVFDDSIELRRGWGADVQVENDPDTPLSQREDWRESTALLRWWQNRRNNGYPWRREFKKKTAKFLQDNRWQIERCGRHWRIEATARRSARLASGAAAVSPDEEWDFLFHNVVSVREYYHQVGKMAFRQVAPKECAGKYCRDCSPKTFKHPPEFRNLPKIMWCC